MVLEHSATTPFIEPDAHRASNRTQNTGGKCDGTLHIGSLAFDFDDDMDLGLMTYYEAFLATFAGHLTTG